MAEAKKTDYPSAMALLAVARQYLEGAEIIFANKRRLIYPLYFLYFQTVESLLKAYLKTHGKERRGHKLSRLCGEAHNLGLKIERDKLRGHHLQNVAALLESGNIDAAFRYPTRKSRTKPDLAWTRDIVEELLSAVTPVVESTSDKTKSGLPAAFNVILRVDG